MMIMMIISMLKRLEEEGSINSRIIQVGYADDNDDHDSDGDGDENDYIDDEEIGGGGEH